MIKPYPLEINFLRVHRHVKVPEVPVEIYLENVLIGEYTIKEIVPDTDYDYAKKLILDKPIPQFIAYHVVSSEYLECNKFDDHIEFIFKNNIECANERLMNTVGDTKLEPGIYSQPYLTKLYYEVYDFGHIILVVDPDCGIPYKLFFKDIEEKESRRYPKVLLSKEGIFVCEEFDGEEK